MIQYAIIVAGGTGSRMKQIVPKQFLEVGGKPIVVRTIEAFLQFSTDLNLILVLPSEQIDTWTSIKEKYLPSQSIQVISGGKTRFQSVRNGLDIIKEEHGLVAVHDGVRPFVDPEIIAASFQIAALHGCAVASVRLKESLRITDKDGTRALDRSRYRLIQTPQTFKLEILKEAYRQEEENEMTDDASVIEKAGYKVSLFEGSYKNIKITTPEDLLIAEAFVNTKTVF
mgnify:CR=1 FL=1